MVLVRNINTTTSMKLRVGRDGQWTMCHGWPRKKGAQICKSANSQWAGLFLSLFQDLEAGGGRWRKNNWYCRIPWVRLSCVCSLPWYPFCPFSLLLCSFCFSYYINAARPVQDTQWYLWKLLSPACVMRLNDCYLRLEYNMLFGTIWFCFLWLSLQQEALDSPFSFLGSDTRD